MLRSFQVNFCGLFQKTDKLSFDSLKANYFYTLTMAVSMCEKELYLRKSSIQQERNGNEKLTQQKASWKNLTYQLRHSELSRKEKEIEPVNNNSAILYHLQSEKRKKKGIG